jgi:hypothetical protein
MLEEMLQFKCDLNKDIPFFSSSSLGPRWLAPTYVLQSSLAYCTSKVLEVPTCTARHPHAYDARDPLAGKGGTMGKKWPVIFANKWRVPHHLKGSSTCRKSATWDRRLYFPSEGRHAEDFFALKNPMASAGFKSANLVIRGQHDTPDHRIHLRHAHNRIFNEK